MPKKLPKYAQEYIGARLFIQHLIDIGYTANISNEDIEKDIIVKKDIDDGYKDLLDDKICGILGG